jgi:hypothetical protein
MEKTVFEDYIARFKKRLSELNLNEFILYTSDYEGDLDWFDVDVDLDMTSELELHFNFFAFDQAERYVAPRRVKIKDGELVFDLQYQELNYEYGPDELGYYANLTIEDLLDKFPKSDIEKCFECMLEYMHNDDVVELNTMPKEN